MLFQNFFNKGVKVTSHHFVEIRLSELEVSCTTQNIIDPFAILAMSFNVVVGGQKVSFEIPQKLE